jgi:hypothetical protein
MHSLQKKGYSWLQLSGGYCLVRLRDFLNRNRNGCETVGEGEDKRQGDEKVEEPNSPRFEIDFKVKARGPALQQQMITSRLA